MQTVKTLKSRSQDGLKQLLTLGKERPETIKTWGVTAGAAVAGGLAMSAGAPGLVAIFTSLASLPVSLMVGAIGGGVLGWRYLKRQKTANTDTVPTAMNPLMERILVDVEPAPVAVLVTTADNQDPLATVDTESSTLPVTLADTDDFVAASAAETENFTPADEGLTLAPDLTPEFTAEPTVEQPSTLVDTPIAPADLQPDILERIVGIGPVFAARLHRAGIHTFAQLAVLQPEQLLEIMATTRGGQLIDAAAWITQAGQLAAKTA